MTELQAERQTPASGTAAQLVVLCHGVGATGEDLISLASYWAGELPHATFAAPDAPQPYDGGGPMRQWWSLADRNPAKMAAGVAGARPALDAFIDAELLRLGLPADAYALAGFSQGAMMVLYAGLRRVTPPRAIVGYSGALLAPGELSQRRNSAPVLLVHGLSDDVVPPQRSRDAEAALRAAGVPVEAVYRPGLGHAIDPAGLDAGAVALRRGFGL